MRTLLSMDSQHPQEAVLATPARQRILDAALGLIQQKGLSPDAEEPGEVALWTGREAR